MAMTVLVLPSCRSLESAIAAHATITATATTHTHDTIVLRDSIFVSEKQRGDTIYLTRTAYRDRWHTRLVHDTIVDIRVEKEVIQLPPERYIPPFYKRCTIALWIAIALVIALATAYYLIRLLTR